MTEDKTCLHSMVASQPSWISRKQNERHQLSVGGINTQQPNGCDKTLALKAGLFKISPNSKLNYAKPSRQQQLGALGPTAFAVT